MQTPPQILKTTGKMAYSTPAVQLSPFIGFYAVVISNRLKKWTHKISDGNNTVSCKKQ